MELPASPPIINVGPQLYAFFGIGVSLFVDECLESTSLIRARTKSSNSSAETGIVKEEGLVFNDFLPSSEFSARFCLCLAAALVDAFEGRGSGEHLVQEQCAGRSDDGMNIPRSYHSLLISQFVGPYVAPDGTLLLLILGTLLKCH